MNFSITQNCPPFLTSALLSHVSLPLCALCEPENQRRSLVPKTRDLSRSPGFSGSALPLPSDAKLVVLRGTVEAKSAVDGKWNSLKSGVFVSRGTKNSAVVVQRTQTCVYKDRKNFIGFPFDLRNLILKPWREQELKDLRTVPFVLVEGSRRRVSEFVVVNVDESRHPLPFTTVYLNFHPVNASPYKYKLVDALFRHEYPNGELRAQWVCKRRMKMLSIIEGFLVASRW